MMALDVLAIGAHPDDVELGCGATLALLAQQGRRVGILHLTSGEKGTRGSAEGRRQEARQAGELLGVVAVTFLDCGDGELRRGAAEEDAVIDQIRNTRPELVLGPPPQDRHPDHGRAYALIRDACFYAGLARRETNLGALSPKPSASHRPAVLFSYMQHDLFTPSFIVDVSSTWEIKQRALAQYRSQLHQPDPSTEERALTPTKIASPEFAAAMEGRGRHYGLLIGTTFGEPFWSLNPLSVRDPWSLRPKGIP